LIFLIISSLFRIEITASGSERVAPLRSRIVTDFSDVSLSMDALVENVDVLDVIEVSHPMG
jgi:hypothetical protein